MLTPNFHKQDDLFGHHWLPNWLVDETVYSLAARYHRLSGHHSPSATCRMLFGHAKRGYQHDLPAGLDCLSERMLGNLGTGAEIALNHTVLPYYLPFRNTEDSHQSVSSMQGSSVGSLKFTLGILTSRLRSQHPLKACSLCIEQDTEILGVSYWHLNHQYPTTLLCPIHDIPLWREHSKSDGAARFRFLLPDDIPNAARKFPKIDFASPEFTIIQRISQATIALAQLPESFHFDHQRLLAVHGKRLRYEGLLSSGRRLRVTEIAKRFLAWVSPLKQFPEFAGLPGTFRQASNQIGSLLRPSRTGTHPTRHLSMIVWLHGNWATFMDNYQTYTAVVSEPMPSAQPREDESSAIQQKALKHIENGLSITAIAHRLGVSVSTVQHIAARHGHKILRRGKKLTLGKCERLVKLAKNGLNKKELAEELSVTEQTVMRFIRTEAGLKDSWQSSVFQRERSTRRNTWAQVRRDNPNSGIKALRSIASACYAWLYRNDRQWLEQMNRKLPKIHAGNNCRTDWETRDRHLAARIEEALTNLCMKSRPELPTVSDLCATVPELRAKLAKLQRLPLTSQIMRGRVRGIHGHQQPENSARDGV